MTPQKFPLLAVALGAIALASSSFAQSITMTLDDYQPQSPTYSGKAGTGTFDDPAALQYYTVQSQTGNATLFPDHLDLFCIELAQTVTPHTQYTFDVLSPDQGSSGGPFSPLGANIPFAGIGAARADNLERLYAHVFASGYNPATVLDTADKKASFQLAVWELSHDDNFDLKNPSTTSTIDFYVTSTGNAVDEAQALVTWVQNNPNATKMDLLALHNGTYQDFLVPTPEALAAIPEPSTYALLTGLAALSLTVWRRRFSPAGC